MRNRSQVAMFCTILTTRERGYNVRFTGSLGSHSIRSSGTLALAPSSPFPSPFAGFPRLPFSVLVPEAEVSPASSSSISLPEKGARDTRSIYLTPYNTYGVTDQGKV